MPENLPENLPEYQLREPETLTAAPQISYRFSPQGIGKLTEAVAKARSEFGVVVKTADNPFYKDGQGKPRKYADLAELISATAKPLALQGVYLFQFPTVDTANQTVGLISLLSHSSGEWLESTISGCPAFQKTDRGVRFDAQTIGIAVTYLRRYSSGSILNLGAEDDDGNGVVQQPTKQEQPKPHFVTGLSVVGRKPSAVDRPENGRNFNTPSLISSVATASKIDPANPNGDTDGCPLSDEDIPKKAADGDPLPTAEQKKIYAGFLRGYKQDSRALKTWVEKEAGAEYNNISNQQFNQLFVKLDKAAKDGPEGVTKLIGGGI